MKYIDFRTEKEVIASGEMMVLMFMVINIPIYNCIAAIFIEIRPIADLFKIKTCIKKLSNIILFFDF